jgi:large subunit ribosomal protein L35
MTARVPVHAGTLSCFYGYCRRQRSAACMLSRPGGPSEISRWRQPPDPANKPAKPRRGARTAARAHFPQKEIAPAHFPDTVPTPMPKSIARRKTKKAVAKRFKITATGKLLRRKPGLRHLASSKSAKRKRKLGKVGQVHETMVDRVKECLPFG